MSAVAYESRRVVCSRCGEGAFGGVPSYLTRVGRAYQHADMRACAYVVQRRIALRAALPAWHQLYLWLRDRLSR